MDTPISCCKYAAYALYSPSIRYSSFTDDVHSCLLGTKAAADRDEHPLASTSQKHTPLFRVVTRTAASVSKIDIRDTPLFRVVNERGVKLEASVGTLVQEPVHFRFRDRAHHLFFFQVSKTIVL